MDPWSAGLQALGILKGGAASAPAQSSSSGNFSNQFQMNGIAGWNVNMGGDGPPTRQAFGRTNAFVMGLTGLNTADGTSAGNGIAASNVATSRSWVSLALVAALAAGAVWVLKK